MRVYSEISLRNFQFWGGAKLNADMLTIEELDNVEDVLTDICGDEIGETMINDIFWFEFDSVCEWIGIRYDEKSQELDFQLLIYASLRYAFRNPSVVLANTRLTTLRRSSKEACPSFVTKIGSIVPFITASI